jgi:hypothetical protein
MHGLSAVFIPAKVDQPLRNSFLAVAQAKEATSKENENKSQGRQKLKDNAPGLKSHN